MILILKPSNLDFVSKCITFQFVWKNVQSQEYSFCGIYLCYYDNVMFHLKQKRKGKKKMKKRKKAETHPWKHKSGSVDSESGVQNTALLVHNTCMCRTFGTTKNNIEKINGSWTLNSGMSWHYKVSL